MDLVEIAIPGLTNPCIKWHDTHGVTRGGVYNCLRLRDVYSPLCFVGIDVLSVHHCLRNDKILNRLSLIGI